MQYIALKELKKNPNNPRIIKDEGFKKLKASLKSKRGKDHFEARPCIVSTRTGENIIIAGNTRYQAAKDLGWKEIPVVIMEGLTEDQENEIIIRDNVSNGEWDWGTLTSEWDVKKLEEWGLDIPELEILDEEVEATEDDYEMPDEVKTDIVLGDLIEIGEHRLLCGDSTNIKHVEKLMDGSKADMCHTDPPYNIDYQGGSKKREKIANDKLEDFPKFLYDVYTTISTVLIPGGAMYVWHASSETHNFITQYIEAGFLFKSYIVWNKNNSTFGRADYHWKHEPCIYGWLVVRTNGTEIENKQRYGILKDLQGQMNTRQ